MALQLVIPSLSFLPSPPQRLTAFKSMHQMCLPRPIRCSATIQTYSTTVSRRSGNYKPSIWDYDFVQSLRSDYKGEMHAISLEKLKEDTRRLLKEVVDPMAQLDLIDTLQRLGVGYLFDMEIEQVLSKISSSKENTGIEKDLSGAALRFRLLRQHGYEVSPDVFNNFKKEMGGFKSSLSTDINGMLSLYEASHLSFEGETLLDEARAFTSIHLKNIKGNIDPILLKKVEHALDLPLHQRMVWSEIRWYIDIYEREEDMNPVFLELAKHTFNTVQTIHQRDLRSLSRWWKDLGLGEKLSFTRDRLVECFLWSVGLTFEPQFGVCREVLTKVIQLVTTIDDVFDVYGSLDELELFTVAVERWDLEAMEQLPEYIKICFLALHNTVNEIAYDILKEQGVNILPHLKKLWAEMFRAQLLEAKWYHSGYKPTLDEYLKNSWISVSGPVIHGHVYFSLGEKITVEALNCLDNHSNIIPWSSMILRLCDDLGTSTDEIARGDVPKSIQCYMHEAGVSEAIARDHVKDTLISNTWKKINEYVVNNSHFPRTFINASVNLARMSHYMYHYGDGHGDPDSDAKSRVMSFLVEPLQVDASKDISFYVDKELV